MYDIPPPKEIWSQRIEWLNQANEDSQHPLASYIVSEHACALSMDVYSAFCAGAWISVIIIAHAVADASLRGNDRKSTSAKVFGDDKDLRWLRKLRNSLVHAQNESPKITVDDIWLNQEELELNARRAVKIMFRAIYSDLGT